MKRKTKIFCQICRSSPTLSHSHTSFFLSLGFVISFSSFVFLIGVMTFSTQKEITFNINFSFTKYKNRFSFIGFLKHLFFSLRNVTDDAADPVIFIIVIIFVFFIAVFDVMLSLNMFCC